MNVLIVALALFLAGCACHQVKPDTPIHVLRCHAVIDDVHCLEGAMSALTVCSCTLDL
jgi:hypothetical protein